MDAMNTFAGPKSKELIFSFGPFRLIPSRQLVLLGNRPVKLGGRAFELLQLLVQRHGELVGKDELMAAVWPNMFVHESNLKVNIYSLRRSLGDIQLHPTYIATIPGRGYRFIAAVQTSIADIERSIDFPTEPALAARLPALHDIVGREAEIADILGALRRKQHVTVVGTGGVGKTTVAVAAAARVLTSEFADGVCFVDLATIDDPTLLPAAVVTALGIIGHSEDPLTAILNDLHSRQMLIVLDNCEHVRPAATIFASKLAASLGKAKLLVTSREPLGTSAEYIVRIGPLASPAPAARPTLEEALRFPAVELFVRRASEWAGYELVEADCGAIASICRSLDGVPLAIELVAAEVEVRGLHGLLPMLDHCLGFKNKGGHSIPARQETLTATIDWSFRLLSPVEAAIFRLVSVFAEAFEPEDVIPVADAIGLSPTDVATGLGGLVAKSLLTANVNGAALRYRFLVD